MSDMNWETFRSALTGHRLPAALVDLDAVERNSAKLQDKLRGRDKTLRVASKSVRHLGLLRRLMAWGAPQTVGVMCFTVDEAVFLAEQGFDDLLVAYPSVQVDALRRAAGQVKAGKTLRLMADCSEHLAALAAAARDVGCTLEVVLELDVSYRPVGGLHLGVRRSPIRHPQALLELAREVRAHSGLRLVGLMAYEAHVAGLGDASPFTSATNPARRALKRLAQPAVARLRAAAVRLLREDGFELPLVNGGGTGSVHLTVAEEAVTEVTAGSGFLCPHLFDYYADLDLEPAAFFALEVCRSSDAGYLTCAGGGYVASGEPGWDRLPLPWRPEGLRYVGMEGAGEVQTPLTCRSDAAAPAIGEPVIFRHAKAGELAERFNQYLLLRDGRVVAEEPTYRGQGQAFL